MKKFLTRKYTVDKVVWAQLLGSFIISLILTYLFYLCLTDEREFLQSLLEAASDKEVAKQYALIMMPILIIICVTFQLGSIVIMGSSTNIQKGKKRS